MTCFLFQETLTPIWKINRNIKLSNYVYRIQSWLYFLANSPVTHVCMRCFVVNNWLSCQNKTWQVLNSVLYFRCTHVSHSHFGYPDFIDFLGYSRTFWMKTSALRNLDIWLANALPRYDKTTSVLASVFNLYCVILV